jgi:hypothetical protein
MAEMGSRSESFKLATTNRGSVSKKSGVHLQLSIPASLSKFETGANNGEPLKTRQFRGSYEVIMKVPTTAIWPSASFYDLSYLNFTPRILIERGRMMVGYSVDLNHYSGI